MSKKISPIEEIIQIRSRNTFNHRSYLLGYRLGALNDSFKKINQQSPKELLKYFPIGMVACFEAYFRAIYEELIDFGEPFSENALEFSRRSQKLQIDLGFLKAIQSKTVTIGQIIAHQLPISRLEHIDNAMSQLMGVKFIEKLSSTYDRVTVELEGKPKVPMIKELDKTLKYVDKTFELRHIYCHEAATSEENVKPEIILECHNHSNLFLKAVDQLVWNLVAPNSPLTQSEMNKEASERFKIADRDMKEIYEKIMAKIREDRKKEFVVAQETWEKFLKAEAEFYANEYRGGSLKPAVYGWALERITRQRETDLKKLYDQISDGRY